jgi:hypothetical protein
MYMIFVAWFLVGLSWNGAYSARHDENDYVTGAADIIAGRYNAYVTAGTGTLNRPYLYPLFLSLIMLFKDYMQESWVFIPPVEFRVCASIVQGCLFVMAVSRLASTVQRFGSRFADGVRLGLLGQPFLAFLMSDLLSDTLSLIIWIYLSSVLLEIVSCKRMLNSRGHVLMFGIGALLGALVVTRSANMPAALFGLLIISICTCGQLLVMFVYEASDVPRLKRLAAAAVTSVTALCIGFALAIVPQALVMADRFSSGGASGQFWGAGSAATAYGLTMLKYSSSVSDCAGVVPAAVPYGNPFGVSELELVWIQQGVMGLVLYYAVNPLYALLHVFNGINYDFPTTYIMSWNLYSNRVFNLVSAMILAVAVAGAVVRGNAGLGVIPHLDRRYGFGLVVVSCCVGVSALQLTIISVENRYGVVLWSWLSAWSGIVLTSVVAPASVWRRVYFAIVCGMLVVGILLLSEWVLAQSSIVSKAYILGC